MLSRMRDQVAALGERFSTHLTFMWLFTSVYVGVLLHVTLLVESLSAELTGVRSGVGMD